MCNLSDALIRILESYLDAKPPQFITQPEIITQIEKKHEHLREQSLSTRVRRRINTLVECRILSEEGGIIGPGSRWQSVPIDQLEE